MKIYINKEILQRLREEEINLDYVGTVLIILTCLYQGDYETLDNIDDNNTSKRLLLLYRYLYRKDYLEIPAAGTEPNIHYILTAKGHELIKFALSFENDEIHKEMLPEIMEIEQIPNQNIEENPDDWIIDWLDLFPSGVHRGRSLKTNRKDCTERMQWFLKNYPYTRNEIMEATKRYIDGYASGMDKFDFMRNSTYFIYKGHASDRISDLASACEMLKSKPTINNFNFERDTI